VKFNKKTGLYELLKGKDKNKDQSYSLSFLTQKQLKHIILPLSNYTKAEVYKIAKKEGFPYFEKIKQSQNFCFVSNKALPFFIQKEIGTNPGPIINLKGNILGTHQGLYFYTIGQRKGLGLSGGPAFAAYSAEAAASAAKAGKVSVVRRQRLCRRRAGKPYYVVDFDKKLNKLIVSKDKKDLYKKEAMLSPINFISGKINKKSIKVSAKIRYRSKSASAMLYPLNKNKVKIVFKKPQKAITPGQFCVFYLPRRQAGQKNICLGNGVIKSKI
jgi:tRNA-specific 2-thiouridylase